MVIMMFAKPNNNSFELCHPKQNHKFTGLFEKIPRQAMSHRAFNMHIHLHEHIIVHKYKESTRVVPLLGFRLVAFVFPLLVPVSGEIG